MRRGGDSTPRLGSPPSWLLAPTPPLLNPPNRIYQSALPCPAPPRRYPQGGCGGVSTPRGGGELLRFACSGSSRHHVTTDTQWQQAQQPAARCCPRHVPGPTYVSSAARRGGSRAARGVWQPAGRLGEARLCTMQSLRHRQRHRIHLHLQAVCTLHINHMHSLQRPATLYLPAAHAWSCDETPHFELAAAGSNRRLRIMKNKRYAWLPKDQLLSPSAWHVYCMPETCCRSGRRCMGGTAHVSWGGHRDGR